MMPTDIFGQFMFTFLGAGKEFHSRIVDLIYKLMFFGLRTIDFSKVSYFSLVFAANMLVFEYYQEHNLLAKMMECLLYKILVNKAVIDLNVSFEDLFGQEFQSTKYI